MASTLYSLLPLLSIRTRGGGVAELCLRMGFEPHALSRVEAVNGFVEHMKSAMEEACSAIRKSKNNMAQHYNQQWTLAPEFRPGDKVFLNASNIQTSHPSQKLAHKYLEPFSIIEKIGQYTYKLQLPHSMSCLHPVFNVAKLLGALRDPILRHNSATLPPLVLIDNEGNKEYKVEAILDSWVF